MFGLHFSLMAGEDHIRLPSATRLGQEEELRAALSAGRIQSSFGTANNRAIAVGVAEGSAVGVQNLFIGEGGSALERIGILANIVPREDAAV